MKHHQPITINGPYLNTDSKKWITKKFQIKKLGKFEHWLHVWDCSEIVNFSGMIKFFRYYGYVF